MSVSSEDNEKLLEEINCLKERNEIITEENNEKSKRVELLEEQKTRQTIRNLVLEDKILELKNKVNDLNSEINELTNELESLKEPPMIIGFITELFDDNKVGFKENDARNYIVKYLKSIDREKIVPGARVSLDSSNMVIVDVLSPRKDDLVMAMEVNERPDVKYQDIGGLENAIREIKETVELPITKPELFEEVGINPPNGIMLYGRPGAGKTLLAKAVAGETDSTFIKLTGSEIIKKYLGEGSEYVKQIFELAREKSPAIIFIDEIDALAAKRKNNPSSTEKEVQRTLMQLLSELDGFESRGNVGIIAATNRIDTLDDALIRPGRFDRLIEIPLPNKNGRRKIMEIHTKKMNLDSNIDFDCISELTEGFSGADLKAVCSEAGMFAIRNNRKKVFSDDFLDAVEKIENSRIK